MTAAAACDQLTLPLTESELDAAFREYDARNPHVYAAFRERARMLLSAGRRHYGAKGIMEAVRFHLAVSGDDGFKINNNFTSRYARKLAEEDDRFAGFFEFRELRS